MKIIVALGLSLALAAPALADTAPRKEKLVCKRDTSVGSRLSRSTCHTKAEWEALEADRSDQANRLVGQSVQDGRDSFIPGPKPE